ncbi:MAG: efflux RND transporter periplasmic adaptor subunit [Deltaproteobacteria bacterium]|jgi:membrane fusion protein (multidrug efflux system)|nr:efflux RND transporter periplasmic adaptor subunit [Deltaproteobacteria bacterium]
MPLFKHLKNIFVLIPFIIVVLAVLAVMSGWLWRTPPVPPRPQAVTLTTVNTREAQSSYEVIGLLEADQKVDLLARVSGFLVGLDFAEGDKVVKGQALFRIEPEQYEAAVDAAEGALLSAQANFTKAELDFNRTQDLFNKRTAPKSDLDAAQAVLDVTRAAIKTSEATLAQARLNLSYAEIKAPFAGEISDTPFSEGHLLGPESGILATLVSLDPILVNFGLSDKFMAATRLGQGVLPGQNLENMTFRLKINGDTFYPEPGELVYVAPLVDKNTDTIKLKVKFPNPKGILRPNQSVTVAIEAKVPPKALLLPKPLVMSNNQGRFVFQAVMAPARGAPEGSPPYLQAKMTYVKLGREYENGYEVLEGVKEGEEIISLGLMASGAMLREGMPVVVQPAPDAAGSEAKGPASPNAAQ